MAINPCVFDYVNMSYVDIPDEEESNKIIVECFKKVMDHVPESAKKEIEILKQKNEILMSFVETVIRVSSQCAANKINMNPIALEAFGRATKILLDHVQGT